MERVHLARPPQVRRHAWRTVLNVTGSPQMGGAQPQAVRRTPQSRSLGPRDELGGVPEILEIPRPCAAWTERRLPSGRPALEILGRCQMIIISLLATVGCAPSLTFLPGYPAPFTLFSFLLYSD